MHESARFQERVKKHLSYFLEKMTRPTPSRPDGELSNSSSCKTVSHLVPMNTVFLTESLNIVVVILQYFF